MKLQRMSLMFVSILALLLLVGIDSNIFAQGRRGGPPATNPSTSRPGMGNVDRGISTSSDRSNRRSDTGLGRASDNSMGRSDDGLNRARNGGLNGRIPSEKELNRFRGIARKLDTTAEDLRTDYRAALESNPDLKFGEFVAANVIADNLNQNHPNITAGAILLGLEDGDSIGKTLQNLGLSSEEAKQAKREAERQIKESKKNN